MTEPKTDPRILRTRKLIMDSFIELSSKKEFRDITVKDITTKAMINRATFYYHFQDIYDLLEKALSEVLLINLNGELFENQSLNEQTISEMFLAVTNFQESLSNRCHRGYEDTIARIIREQLEVLIYKMLLKKDDVQEDQALKITAGMLSWAIYGASVKWKQYRDLQPEAFIKLVIPYIINGVEAPLVKNGN